MSFALGFVQTLPLRPLRAMEALYWYITGRKVRARNRLRIAKSQTFLAYRFWIKHVECLPDLAARVSTIVSSWQYRPRFSVIVQVPADTSRASVNATLVSVHEQWYPHVEVLIVTQKAVHDPVLSELKQCPVFSAHEGGNPLLGAVKQTSGEYILPVRAGDKLSPAALFWLAQTLQGSDPAILYGDEDSLNWRRQRGRPWFKPQWNEEMILVQDYISSACALRTDRLKARLVSGDGASLSSVYALVLKLTQDASLQVVHVPHVLVHRVGTKPGADRDERLAALAHRLNGQGTELSFHENDVIQVRWPLPAHPPKVSIIIPTRDKVGLLRACLDSLLSKTDYPDYEVIIVDNGSVKADTLRFFASLAEEPRVRILSYPAAYNYSAINNFAATHAHGKFLCLLNNDTEILSGDWLTELMRQAVRPHVGAVGAKLLYPDGSIQHAGVAVGLGDAAGHAHRFLRQGKTGYFNRPHIPHYVSAVTAACLVVEKHKFDAVGGLDEENLAIAFNDVDLCLKLEAAGWRNVYTPYAVLIHHESKSRGKDISPQHIARYRRELAALQERWDTRTCTDPLHHPSLDRAQETFTIRL